MPSAFSWLDFAESDRQRAMQVIDLFREKSTVDELGFAPIRDGFADYLFPGTSTIQTRARYFLFVPWLASAFKQGPQSVEELAAKLRRREARLIQSLLNRGEEQGGIIGREAQGKLKRMPSSVYWRGLYQWGIRLFPGSIDQYLKRVLRGENGRRVARTDDGEPVGAVARHWHPGLPAAPDDLFERASLDLTKIEAEFLRERICASYPESMLAYVVNRSTGALNARFAWAEEVRAMLPSALKEVVEHARLFSLCAWGGPLTYARMIAVMKGNAELVAAIDDSLASWQAELEDDAEVLTRWDLDAFWAHVHTMNPRLSPGTRDFAERWIKTALRAAEGQRVWNDAAVSEAIKKRELQLKGGRARLRPENQRGRDRWQGDAEAFRMDYRWRPAQIIVNDIVRGLQNDGDARA
ncbi:MAG: hypothetical protein HBSAPP03_14710 [Phycisphaerae bacterium]|nr:MAG: hypothetical protein HBSAPP03_14710 [Phycisphaerae bacterium]